MTDDLTKLARKRECRRQQPHDRYGFCGHCSPECCQCGCWRQEWYWRCCPMCGDLYPNNPDDFELDGTPIWYEDTPIWHEDVQAYLSVYSRLVALLDAPTHEAFIHKALMIEELLFEPELAECVCDDGPNGFYATRGDPAILARRPRPHHLTDTDTNPTEEIS